MKIGLDLKGTQALSIALLKKNSIAWENVANKSLVEMFNRGAHPPGTPVDTGELRLDRKVRKASAGKSFHGEFGYNKDYSGFVEYGYRTRGGGYVPGQYYLRNNVETQKGIYRNDLLVEMRK